jgi:hypothetical protein
VEAECANAPFACLAILLALYKKDGAAGNNGSHWTVPDGLVIFRLTSKKLFYGPGITPGVHKTTPQSDVIKMVGVRPPTSPLGWFAVVSSLV